MNVASESYWPTRTPALTPRLQRTGPLSKGVLDLDEDASLDDKIKVISYLPTRGLRCVPEWRDAFLCLLTVNGHAVHAVLQTD